jgi:holo-[acyl-carrier protein] synthase
MNEGPVLGTGIDLVENDRMQELLARWGPKFKDKVFLPDEQGYCESKAFPWLHYAGRFAVRKRCPRPSEQGSGRPSAGWTLKCCGTPRAGRLR